MEVDYHETIMQCFKIPCSVAGNLKISCDKKNSIIVFWSKYELFVYENLNFNHFSKKIEPQFEILDVIVMKDCLICLDCSGNLNVDTFESFLIWKQNIKLICAYEIMDTKYVVSLQFEQNRATLFVNKFCLDDSPIESAQLQLAMPHEDWMTPGESGIMVCDHIKSEHAKSIKNLFNMEKSDSNYLVVIVSLDKRNVYAVYFPKQHELQLNSPNLWMKLYKSHTDIVDIKITVTCDVWVLVGLSGGNIIRIPLLLKNQKLEVYHLNTSINKFTIFANTIIYTDVLTMWKNDYAFSEPDSIFEQFKVRNVRDFCLIKDQIICITFSNLIYSFNISNSTSYVTPPDIDDASAVQLTTNADYLQDIIETVQKSEELLKNINKESQYLMALSLSKRQDIMDELIHVTASVYDDYQNLTSKNSDLTLTDEPNAYYELESFYFLINIVVNRIQHKLNKLLSDVLGDIKIHITLFECGILKTTSIQIKEQLTTKNFVIALKGKNLNIRRIQVLFKIITNVPGKYDQNQSLWTILYQKCIDLTAENFINFKSNKNGTYLKDDEIPLDMLIYKRAQHLHGTEYKFNVTNYENREWTFYVKLPNSILHMEHILGLMDPLDSKKSHNCLKHLMKVSKSKNCLEFQVGKEQVMLHIEGEHLKVTCSDVMVASDIRNFFSGIIFNTFKDELGKKFIDHKYYTTVENLKRDINNCISKRISAEEFVILLTRFLRKIYCLIPI